MAEDFLDKKIKGNIAETIVEEMFKRLGFYVLRTGQEYSLHPLTQIKYFVKKCGGKFDFENEQEEVDFLKRLPDFVIIHPSGKVRFLEVKYRYNAQVREDIFETLLRFPNCILLVVNSNIGEDLAKANFGEVNLSPTAEEREKLAKSRFHIWLADEPVFKNTDGSEEFQTEVQTKTIPFSDWLKGEFNLDNEGFIEHFEAMVEKWFRNGK